MNLVFDGYRVAQRINLFIEGIESQTANIHCKNDDSCYFMELYPLAPNLNLNLHCSYDYACSRGKVSGIHTIHFSDKNSVTQLFLPYTHNSSIHSNDHK